MEGYGRVDREDSLDCGESLVSREWGLQDGEWTHGELSFGVGQAGGERGELQERGLGRWVGPECGLGRSGQERSRVDARVDRRMDCGRGGPCLDRVDIKQQGMSRHQASGAHGGRKYFEEKK